MAGVDKRAKERIFVALDYDNMEDAIFGLEIS